LSGGNGNDVLVGGAGNDTLSGNGGNDWFTYDTNAIFTASSIGSDIIQDFTRGSDKMVIDKTTFTAIKSNAGIGFSVANDFAVVSSDSVASTSQALIVFNSVNGRLFYNQNGIADGLGSGSLFATLSGVSTLQGIEPRFLQKRK
jgi:Ca2+-binding RTX toxin-like protein